VIKSAISSRFTALIGLKVVADVPFARLKRNASAIWQKKGLHIAFPERTR